MKIVKNLSKLLISTLTVMLVITLLPNIVFAEEDDAYAKYRTGSGYVALGDSFTRGFGEGENFETHDGKMDSLKDKNCRNVKGSFSYQVAQTLGLYSPDDITDATAQYWPIAQNAISCTFINDLLGIDDGIVDEYVYSEKCKGRYNVDLTYFGDEESYDIGGVNRYGKVGSAMSIRDMVDNASIISIELGMGDIFERAYELYLSDIQFENQQQALEAISNFVVESYRAIDRFKKAYSALLDYIKEANSDAAVIIIGTVNTMEDIVVWKDSSLSIGNLISPAFDLLNSYYRQMAQEYDYIFVDIANVDSYISENSYSIYQSLQQERHIVTHPTAEGYTQIARMIINALNENDLNEYQRDTNIRVDLGRFNSVSKVKVNGKETTNYTFEDHYLIVEYDNIYATILTVEENVDGNDRVACYYLSYNDGYIVNRLYISNHFLKQEKKIISKILIADFDTFPSFTANTQQEVEKTDIEQSQINQDEENIIEEPLEQIVEENNNISEQQLQKIEYFFNEEIVDKAKDINNKIKSIFR